MEYMTTFYFLCAIAVFYLFISKVLDRMMKDGNGIIRFLGYIIAIIIAIGVLWLVLNYCFNFNMLTYLQ